MVKSFMEKTYVSQRYCIVKKKERIQVVLIWWPYLRELDYFFLHATILVKENLDESITDTWNKNLEGNRRFLWSLMTGACSERKLQKAGENQKTRIKKMQEIVRSARTAVANLKSEMPRTLSLFPLLCTFLRENFDDIVKVEQIRISSKNKI